MKSPCLKIPGGHGLPSPVLKVAAVFMVCVGVLWMAAGKYETHLLGDVRGQIQIRLAMYGSVLTEALNQRLEVLAALEGFMAMHPDDAVFRSRFETFASGLHAGKPGLRAIQIFPPEGKVLVYPKAGNEAMLDRRLKDLVNDERPGVRRDVKLAMELRSTVISGPYPLRQGGFGLVARKPVFQGRTFRGLAVTVIELEPVLKITRLSQSGGSPLAIALRRPGEPAFWGEDNVFAGQPVLHPLLLPETAWQIGAIPAQGWKKKILGPLMVFWAAGGGMSLLAAGLVLSISRRQERLSLLVQERTALLEKSQEQYRQLYDTNPDPLFVLDGKGLILQANPAACRQYGYSKEQLHQLFISDLTIPGSEPQISELTAGETSGVRNAILGQLRKDGTQFEAGVNSLPVWFRNQACIFITVRDISQPREAEARLAESENRYKALIASMPSGFAVYEMIYGPEGTPRDYRFIEVNAAFEQLTGLQAGTLLGKRSLEVFPGTDPQWMEYFERVTRTGRPSRFENYSKALGKYYEVAAYKPAENQFAAIFSDITQRRAVEKERMELQKSLEEKVREQTDELRLRVGESERLNRAMMNLLDDLKTSNRELEVSSQSLAEANRELEAFSYSVSHDLRAPLRGIDGFCMVLLEDYAGRLDDQGRHYLSRIRSATIHMGKLIDDLLRLSRISRATPSLVLMDLSALAREIAQELKKSAPRRTVDFQIEPDIRVTADPRLMHIVLENLLGNAFKFTGRRDHAKIEFGRDQTDGQTVFRVRDNGDGFDMRYADKLFTPFQRLHRTDEFEGTGIGLSIVNRIIQRHKGRIWAQSAVGEGAGFYFTLDDQRRPDGKNYLADRGQPR